MHAYKPERLNPNSRNGNAIAQTVTEHPALCAGAALSLFVMSMIFVNAIWYQPGKHPAPLFTTRNADQTTPVKTKVAVAKVKTTAKKAADPVIASSSEELLREVQTALSVRGYYSGKLDGVYGSRTKAAINAFQKDHSIKQTGEVSLRLLTQVLVSPSSRPSEVPLPDKSELAQKVEAPKTVTAETAAPKEQTDGLVARIQSGLRAYGYDDLVVDGRMGQQTATAIQRFQLDYGMKITGEPSKGVLDKLRDIGAYKQG